MNITGERVSFVCIRTLERRGDMRDEKIHVIQKKVGKPKIKFCRIWIYIFYVI